MQSASHSLRCRQENPGHPMCSHLPRLLFRPAPRFAPGLCRYFCSASALTFQSPCVVNQNPTSASAGWAGLFSLGPSFPVGWEMDHLEGEGKATRPRSFSSTLAPLDGTWHPYAVMDRPVCWWGLVDLHGVAAPAVPAGPAGMARLRDHFHNGPGFVKASFWVSSLWKRGGKSEFCPNLVFLAKIARLTHEPVSDKCQQPAMGAQTRRGSCTMAADLALVRCVVWGLLTQNSHGRAPRCALPLQS